MILAIWTSASQTEAFHVRHFAYMDDRTFFCKCLGGIKATIDAWAEWSKAVNLKESPSKTQVCGKPRNHPMRLGLPTPTGLRVI